MLHKKNLISEDSNGAPDMSNFDEKACGQETQSKQFSSLAHQVAQIYTPKQEQKYIPRPEPISAKKKASTTSFLSKIFHLSAPISEKPLRFTTKEEQIQLNKKSELSDLPIYIKKAHLEYLFAKAEHLNNPNRVSKISKRDAALTKLQKLTLKESHDHGDTFALNEMTRFVNTENLKIMEAYDKVIQKDRISGFFRSISSFFSNIFCCFHHSENKTYPPAVENQPILGVEHRTKF